MSDAPKLIDATGLVEETRNVIKGLDEMILSGKGTPELLGYRDQAVASLRAIEAEAAKQPPAPPPPSIDDQWGAWAASWRQRQHDQRAGIIGTPPAPQPAPNRSEADEAFRQWAADFKARSTRPRNHWE